MRCSPTRPRGRCCSTLCRRTPVSRHRPRVRNASRRMAPIPTARTAWQASVSDRVYTVARMLAFALLLERQRKLSHIRSVCRLGLILIVCFIHVNVNTLWHLSRCLRCFVSSGILDPTPGNELRRPHPPPRRESSSQRKSKWYFASRKCEPSAGSQTAVCKTCVDRYANIECSPSGPRSHSLNNGSHQQFDLTKDFR